METRNLSFAKIRPILGPLGIVFGLLFISLIVVRWGINQVLVQREEIRRHEMEENALISKINILKEAANEVLPATDLSVNALPSQNPALALISQIKTLAVENAISLEDFGVASELATEKDFSKVEIGFEALGETTALLSFIRKLKDVAPLSSLEKIRVDEIAQIARVETVIVGYWSPFPEVIPSVSGPTKGFTQEEKETILALMQLRAPTHFELNPEAPGTRSDPFSY